MASSRVEAALKAREQRKTLSNANDTVSSATPTAIPSTAGNSKVQAALEARARRMQAQQQNTMADFSSRLQAEIDAYNERKPVFGEGAFEQTVKSQTTNRSNISKLRKELEANRAYFGEDVANEISTLLDELMGGYDNYVNISQSFATESDYNRAVREAGYAEKYAGKSYGELQGIIAENDTQRESALKNKYIDGAPRQRVIPGQLLSDEEREWVDEYSTTPEVMTVEEYTKLIADAEARIADLQTDWQENIYDAEGNVNPNAQQMIDDIGAVENELEKLKENKWRRSNMDAYDNLRSNSDFERVSRLVPEEQSGNYQYINDVGTARRDALYGKDTYIAAAFAGSDIAASRIRTELLNDYAALDQMTDDEKATYNYIYNKEGSGAAEEYLKYLRYDLDARVARNQTAEMQEFARQVPGASDVLSVGFNLASGAGYLDVIGQKFMKNIQEKNTGEYAGPINYNTSNFTASRVTTAIRGTRAQQIADATGVINLDPDKHPTLSKIFNGKSLGDVYQLGMSMLDSWAVAAMGSWGTVFLSGSAATQGTLDALERGADDNQALAMGALNGFFEFLFEKYEIENLLGQGDKFLKATINQALTESFGEGFTSVANVLADSLVMAENSNYEQAVAAYMAQGLSEEEARKQALLDTAVDIGWDAFGGFIMGGISGGGMSAKNKVGNAIEKRNTASALYGGENTQALVNEALKADPDNGLAKRIQGKINDKKSASGSQLLRLVNQTNKAVTAADKQKIQTAAAERLTALGETGDVQSIASALAKQKAGDKLNKAELKTISDSQYAQQVSSELDPKNIGDERYDTEWAQKIGTGRINVDEYNRLLEAAGVATTTAETAEDMDTLIATDATEAVEGLAELTEADYAEAEAAIDNSDIEAAEEYAGVTVSDAATARALVRDMAMTGADLLDYAKASPAAQYLSEADIETAFSEARAEYDAPETTLPTLRRGSKGGIVRGDGVTLSNIEELVKTHFNKQQARVYKVVSTMSEATGLNVVFYDSSNPKATQEQRDNNGMYKQEDNTIYIDIRSGLMPTDKKSSLSRYLALRTFTHEFVHFIEQFNPKGYNELRSYVFSSLKSRGHNVAEFIELKRKAGMSYDRASREVIAEGLTDILGDERLTQKFADEKRGLFRNLLDKLKEFVDTIKDYFAQVAPSSDPVTNALLDDADGTIRYLDGIVDKFEAAMTGAVENYKAASEAYKAAEAEKAAQRAAQSAQENAKPKADKKPVKKKKPAQTASQAAEREDAQHQSRKALSSEAISFREEINRWAKNGKPADEVFILGSTGNVLQGLGAVESDIYINGDKINTILQDHPEMGLKEIKNIPEILENPVLVLASRNINRGNRMNSRLTIFGMVKAQNGLPVMVAFELHPVENSLYLDDMQKVNSAYTKDGSPEATKNFIEKSRVLYADKDKTASLLHTVGFQNAYRMEQSGYIGNISYANKSVKLTGKNFSEVFTEESTQYQAKEGYIKSYSQRDRVATSIEKYTESLPGVSAASVELSRGMGSHETFYLTIWLDEDTYGDNIYPSAEIRYSGHRDGGSNADYRLWNSDYTSMAELKADIAAIVEAMKNDIYPEDVKLPYRDRADTSTPDIVQYQAKSADSEQTGFVEDKYYARQISKWEELKENSRIKVGNIKNGSALNRVGLPASGMYFDVGKIKKALNDHDDHLTPDILKKIPALLSNPVVIAEYEGNTNTVNVYGNLFVNDDIPVLVAVVMRTDSTGQNLITNIRTVHARSNFAKQINDRTVLYLNENKKMTRKWFQVCGNLSVPLDGTTFGVIRSISFVDRKVNAENNASQKADPDIQAQERVAAIPKRTLMQIAESDESFLEGLTDEQKETLAKYNKELDRLSELEEERAELSAKWRVENFGDKEAGISPNRKAAEKTLAEMHKLDATIDRKYSTIAGMEGEGFRRVLNKARQIAMKKEREKNAAKYERWKDKRDNAEAIRKYRARITKDTAQLADWLKSPGNKNAMRHVPYSVKGAVVGLLDSIDFSNAKLLKGGSPSQAYLRLTAKLERAKNALDPFAPIDVDAYRQNARELLSELGEIGDIDRLVNALTKQATGGKLTTAERDLISRSEFGQRVYNELDDKGRISELYNINDLPEDLIPRMAELVETANSIARSGESNYILHNMTSEELKNLYQIIKDLKKAIRNINEFHSVTEFKRIEDSGRSSINYMHKIKDSENKAGKMNDFVFWQNMRPPQIFERFGSGGVAIYKALVRGDSKLAFNLQELAELSKKTFNPKESAKWENTVREFTFGTEHVRLNVAQIMSLYALYNQEDSRRHILNPDHDGGIRIDNFEAKNKVGIKKKYYDKSTGHRLTAAQIEEILKTITESSDKRPLEVAKKMQEIMAKKGGEWGNEVTMKLWEDKAFTNPNYYPIKVDPDVLEKTNADNQSVGKVSADSSDGSNLYALLNKSFTKERVENSGKRIMIRSIFDVFAEHMSDMAQYNALALPVRDTIKWLNYKEKDATGKVINSVADEMTRAYGRPFKGKAYAVNFVENIIKGFSGTEAMGGNADGFFNKALGYFNRGKVSFNLWVVIQQPLAIARAQTVLGLGDSLKGTFTPTYKRSKAEMLKYSGIAVRKSLGFRDANIRPSVKSMIRQDSNWREWLAEIGMKGAETMDTWTWVAIWSASKQKINKQIRKNILSVKVGSAEYFDAVKELFDDVIYKTQVVDSVLTKSEFMRNPSYLNRTMSSFMSESVATITMALDVCEKFNRAVRTGMNPAEVLKKQGKQIVRTGVVLICAALLEALVQSIRDAWRDDDDYQTFGEKIGEAYVGNIHDTLNPLLKVPIMADLYDTLIYALGEIGVTIKGNEIYGYEPQRIIGMGLDGFWKGGKIILDKIRGEETNYTTYGGIIKLVQGFDALHGTPFYSAAREMVNIITNLFPSTKQYLKTYDPGPKNNVKYGFLDGWLTEEEAINELLELELVEDEDEAFWTVEEWKSGLGNDYSRYDELLDLVRNGGSTTAAIAKLKRHGATDTDIRKAIIDGIGSWYYDDKSINATQAKNYLVKHTDLDEDEAKARVDEWNVRRAYGFGYDSIGEKFKKGEVSEENATRWQKDYGGKTAEEAEHTVTKWKKEKELGISSGDYDDAYLSGDITATQYVEAKAISSTKHAKAIETYNARGKASGFSEEEFYEYFVYCNSIEGEEDADGNPVKDRGKQDLVWEYINSLPISTAQKDALHLALYKESTLKNTPWH